MHEWHRQVVTISKVVSKKPSYTTVSISERMNSDESSNRRRDKTKFGKYLKAWIMFLLQVRMQLFILND